MFASMEVIGYCLVILAVVDFAIARRTAHRWFFVHAVANAVVVVTALALPGLAATLDDPLHAMDGRLAPNVVSMWAPGSMVPISMINAVHLYHVLFFNLNTDELFHHALFLPLVGGPGQYYEWGALRSTLAFAISGLPGGIDYLMLVGVKGGHVSRARQKQVSAALNQWLRERQSSCSRRACTTWRGATIPRWCRSQPTCLSAASPSSTQSTTSAAASAAMSASRAPSLQAPAPPRPLHHPSFPRTRQKPRPPGQPSLEASPAVVTKKRSLHLGLG